MSDDNKRSIVDERKHFELLTSDRKKAVEFAKYIRHMAVPQMETEEGQIFIDELDGPLHDVAKACEKWGKA